MLEANEGCDPAVTAWIRSAWKKVLCFRWQLVDDITSKQWSGIVGLAIAFLYGSCSASMAFANKAVLTSYSFNYPFFLVTCQMAISIVVLELLRLTGRTSLVRFTLSRGWMFLVPSIFYAANCVFALSALGGMNIPMYGLGSSTPTSTQRVFFKIALIMMWCIS